jgi:hypothetical protein
MGNLAGRPPQFVARETCLCRLAPLGTLVTRAGAQHMTSRKGIEALDRCLAGKRARDVNACCLPPVVDAGAIPVETTGHRSPGRRGIKRKRGRGGLGRQGCIRCIRCIGLGHSGIQRFQSGEFSQVDGSFRPWLRRHVGRSGRGLPLDRTAQLRAEPVGGGRCRRDGRRVCPAGVWRRAGRRLTGLGSGLQLQEVRNLHGDRIS